MGPLTGIFNYQYDLQVVPYVFLRGLIRNKFRRKGLPFWRTQTWPLLNAKQHLSNLDQAAPSHWSIHDRCVTTFLLALKSNGKCFCRLFTSLGCKIPGESLKGCGNLSVNKLEHTSSLVSEWEHFKLARQNRWPQQIWASSWTSHNISFELPSRVSGLIRPPRPTVCACRCIQHLSGFKKSPCTHPTCLYTLESQLVHLQLS